MDQMYLARFYQKYFVLMVVKIASDYTLQLLIAVNNKKRVADVWSDNKS